MTQEPKKSKRGREIGGIKSNPYASFGNENGDGETVLPSEGETVAQQHRKTVRPLDSETVTPQDGQTVSLTDHEALKRSDRDTVLPSDSRTALPPHREAVKPKKDKKITFYFTPDEEAKLDVLELDFRRRTGQRINRNDIIRYLLKQCVYLPDDAQFD